MVGISIKSSLAQILAFPLPGYEILLRSLISETVSSSNNGEIQDLPAGELKPGTGQLDKWEPVIICSIPLYF